MADGNGNGKLNHRQRRFVEEYVVDGSPMHAAIRAGYSERNAKNYSKDLLKMPRIRTAIQVRQLRLSQKTEITAEKVIERLWAEANFTGKRASHSARVSALAHLAKHFGLLIERIDMTSEGKELPSTVRVVLVKPDGADGD
jgi:phage terminase small subunit